MNIFLTLTEKVNANPVEHAMFSSFAGKKEFYHSQLVNEMQGDQVHEKMDHICDKGENA